LPGTDFALVHLDVAPVTSGLAVGSLIAGVASIGVALVLGCLGLAGAEEGWGAWVAGAFTILAGVVGVAGVGLGMGALRQIRRSGGPGLIRFIGRGPAIAGMICGGVGLLLTALGLLTVLLVQLR
jgi:hypothetical protein